MECSPDSGRAKNNGGILMIELMKQFGALGFFNEYGYLIDNLGNIMTPIEWEIYAKKLIEENKLIPIYP